MRNSWWEEGWLGATAGLGRRQLQSLQVVSRCWVWLVSGNTAGQIWQLPVSSPCV